jgi:uncharacterized protein involved in type VI secretion and phage assembly
MMNGVVVGIVVENEDPKKMHRIKVEYPVDAESPPITDWCRMITPMAGADRGLVILPEIGTEVLIGFAYRSHNPYVLGAVYNGGDDTPESYANADEENNLRIFWSRNDHMVVFDDTSGAELVGLGAQASSAEDVTSGVIYQVLDDANKTVTEYCDGSTDWKAEKTVSIKCKDLKITASGSVMIEAGSTAVAVAGSSATIDGGSALECTAGMVDINGAPGGSAGSASSIPTPSHPPMK